MFEIKISQGAKPGKGGILPGIKVTPEVAQIRGIPVGKDSISPNRHLDINNVADMLNEVERIRNIAQKPVGLKFVVGSYDWIEEMFEEIYRRGVESAPDFIAVDGGDGGTGAVPMALLDNVGLPLRESLIAVNDLLIKYNLKKRIRLIASGKLITASDVAWELCAGADFVNSARGFMFSLGCIQVFRCHKNTCPTGIATHNKRLQKGLDPADKAEKVYHYAKNMAHEVEVIAHSCGVDGPHNLKRHHVRIMQADGFSVPMDKLCPLPAVKAKYDT
jgi:glutamate synthase domain-containing protein 2